MKCSNMQDCVLRLSQDELSLAFIRQGNIFAEQACSLAYLFFFSSALLHRLTPTIDSHVGNAQCNHSVRLSDAQQLYLGNSVSKATQQQLVQ